MDNYEFAFYTQEIEFNVYFVFKPYS